MNGSRDGGSWPSTVGRSKAARLLAIPAPRNKTLLDQVSGGRDERPADEADRFMAPPDLSNHIEPLSVSSIAVCLSCPRSLRGEVDG